MSAEEVAGLTGFLSNSTETIEIRNATKHRNFNAKHGFTGRQKQILLAGGLLNFTKGQAA